LPTSRDIMESKASTPCLRDILEQFNSTADPIHLQTIKSELYHELIVGNFEGDKYTVWKKFLTDVFTVCQHNVEALTSICELIIQRASGDDILGKLWREQFVKSEQVDCYWLLLSRGHSLSDIWLVPKYGSILNNGAEKSDNLETVTECDDSLYEKMCIDCKTNRIMRRLGRILQYEMSHKYVNITIRAADRARTHVLKYFLNEFPIKFFCEEIYSPLFYILKLAGYNLSTGFLSSLIEVDLPGHQLLGRWYRTYHSKPRTMKELCRYRIRQSLETNILYGVSQLPLPELLRQYVTLPPSEIQEIEESQTVENSNIST
jgi:hypothetical protein